MVEVRYGFCKFRHEISVSFFVGDIEVRNVAKSFEEIVFVQFRRCLVGVESVLEQRVGQRVFWPNTFQVGMNSNNAFGARLAECAFGTIHAGEVPLPLTGIFVVRFLGEIGCAGDMTEDVPTTGSNGEHDRVTRSNMRDIPDDLAILLATPDEAHPVSDDTTLAFFIVLSVRDVAGLIIDRVGIRQPAANDVDWNGQAFRGCRRQETDSLRPNLAQPFRDVFGDVRICIKRVFQVGPPADLHVGVLSLRPMQEEGNIRIGRGRRRSLTESVKIGRKQDWSIQLGRSHILHDIVGCLGER
ncbi:MAG: hypothetical protein IID45_11470, partial [Planctomycetes bacterium]|nr:hypothetical protein [Planctomycetota bacterium]